MVDVERAKKLIISKSKPPGTVAIDTTDSVGFVLAENLKSKNDLPFFHNSAMDGFAIKHSDTLNANREYPLKLKIIRTIKAGDSHNFRLKSGEAAKIMTGALVPNGADTVVKKEDCMEDGKSLFIDQPVSSKQNIRYKGEEIKKGSVGLEKNTFINPAAVGFILELGYKKIKVYKKPEISLLVTGEELAGPDEKLKKGKIKDTNSYSLTAALKKENVQLKTVRRVTDSYKEIKKAISSQLKKSDIVIITGGISVGDYDYIKDILSELNVEKVFWGVSQRPGGPLYFGTYRNKLVFGLPGNPSSALVCFYEYIRPAILKMKGKKEPGIATLKAKLLSDLKKKPGKTHFLRGILESENGNYYVRSAGAQGSHMLKAFSEANCFIIFEKEETLIKKGKDVEVHLLPFAI